MYTANYTTITVDDVLLSNLLEQSTNASAPIVLSKDCVVAGAVISPQILDTLDQLLKQNMQKDWQNSLPITDEEIEGAKVSLSQIKAVKSKKFKFI